MKSIAKILGTCVLTTLGIGSLNAQDSVKIEKQMINDSVLGFVETRYIDGNIHMATYVKGEEGKYSLKSSKTTVFDSLGRIKNIQEINWFNRQRREYVSNPPKNFEKRIETDLFKEKAENKHYLYDSLGRLNQIKYHLNGGREEIDYDDYYFYFNEDDKAVGVLRDMDGNQNFGKGDKMYIPAKDMWIEFNDKDE